MDEILIEMLVKLFKGIMEIEEKWLITPEFQGISVNDMHVLETICINEPKSMSTVAKMMSITTGTLTKSTDGFSDTLQKVRASLQFCSLYCKYFS